MAEGRPLTAPATDLSDREIQRRLPLCRRPRARSTTPRPQSSPSHCASRVSRPAASAAADRRPSDAKGRTLAIRLICYASHPSDAVRRYTLRKLTPGGGAGPARHLVIDYEVAPAPAPSIAGAAGPGDTFAGDLATLCRLVAQYAVTVGCPPGSVVAA